MILKFPLVLVATFAVPALMLFFSKKKLNKHIVEIHKDQYHELSGDSQGTTPPVIHHPSLFARTLQPLWQKLYKKVKPV